jgi:hypothetical protein
VAYRVGLDGVVVDRCSRPGSHVFHDDRTAFFVEATSDSVSVTAWQGGEPKPLGTLGAKMPPRPGVFPFGERVVISKNEQQLFILGDGDARSLGVSAPNPSLDDEGFVAMATGVAARVRRWRYDGTLAWELPAHGLSTLRSGHVFATHERDRIVLVDTRDGQLIADTTLKLTRAERIESIVATARGAIVLIRRHGDNAKYAYLVEKGEAPIALKHDGVAGAMPFEHGMATWSGAADETGMLTLHVWNIAPGE